LWLQKTIKIKKINIKNNYKRKRYINYFYFIETHYDVVKYVAKRLFGWKLQYDKGNFDWDLYWIDTAISPDFLSKLGHH